MLHVRWTQQRRRGWQRRRGVKTKGRCANHPAANPCRVSPGLSLRRRPRYDVAGVSRQRCQTPLLDHSPPTSSFSAAIPPAEGGNPRPRCSGRKSIERRYRILHYTARRPLVRARRRNRVLTRIARPDNLVLTLPHRSLICSTRCRRGQRSGHSQPQPVSRWDRRGASTAVIASGPVPATW